MNNSETPEERQRIVDAIMKKVVPSTHETELDEIRRKRDEVRNKVMTAMRQITAEAVNLPVVDPRYAHSDIGRAILTTTAAHMYLNETRGFNREEALVLLAFQYADATVEFLLGG
jgi:hypothetical protein